MRRDFQGIAVAETRVFAEPIRAQEIASDRVELAVGVLRFFTPPGVTSRVARWGYAPLRTDRVLITDPTGKFLSTSEALIDHPGTMELSDDLRDIFARCRPLGSSRYPRAFLTNRLRGDTSVGYGHVRSGGTHVRSQREDDLVLRRGWSRFCFETVRSRFSTT